MCSLVVHRGKNLVPCRIQPLQTPLLHLLIHNNYCSIHSKLYVADDNWWILFCQCHLRTMKKTSFFKGQTTQLSNWWMYFLKLHISNNWQWNKTAKICTKAFGIMLLCIFVCVCKKQQHFDVFCKNYLEKLESYTYLWKYNFWSKKCPKATGKNCKLTKGLTELKRFLCWEKNTRLQFQEKPQTSTRQKLWLRETKKKVFTSVCYHQMEL